MMIKPIKKLRNKIWLTLSISFSILIVLILAIIYLLMNQNTQRMIYQSLNMRASSEVYSFEDVFFTAVISEDEIQAIYASSNLRATLSEKLVTHAFPLFEEHYHHQISVDEQTWAYIIRDARTITLSEADYTWVIFVNVTELTSKLERLLFLLSVIGGAGLVVTFVGNLFLANQLIKPTIRAFAKEKEVNARQKRFIANATHELRTPFTLLKGSYDEILDCQEETFASQKKWFDIMGFGIERMESLTAELLILSQLENTTKRGLIKSDVVDLDELINEVLAVFEIKAMEKEVTISTNEYLGMTVKQNKEKLRQVILILLDNAIKYVNHQGWIEIDVVLLDGQIKLMVKNSGIGISSEDLPHIFERFYRGDDIAGKSKGHGLGLAIAKETIELLRAQIFAESRVNEITTFGFILPIE